MSGFSPAVVIVHPSGSHNQGYDPEFPLWVTGSTSPPVQTVTGSVALSQTATITGSVNVTNSVFPVTGTVGISQPVTASISNFPAVQTITGTVALAAQPIQITSTGSLPVSVQVLPNITGSVNVTNAVFPVTGTIKADITGTVNVAVQSQPNITGSVHVTNSVLNVTGSLAVDNVVRVTSTGSLPVSVLNNPQIQGMAQSGSTALGFPVLVAGAGDDHVVRPIRTDVGGEVYVVTDVPTLTTASVAQGWVLVSAGAGVRTALRATTYAEPAAEAQRSIKSTSANDTIAGTGARQVRITYYDSNMNGPFTETVDTNGTGFTNTVATNIRYIEKMEIIQVGSVGWNVGTVSLYSTTAGLGTIIGSIGFGTVTTTIGDNKTLWAHHYIRNAATGSVLGLSCGTNGNQTGFTYLMSENTAAATNPEVLITEQFTIAQANDSFIRAYRFPIRIFGPARITQYVVSNGNNTRFYGGFDFMER